MSVGDLAHHNENEVNYCPNSQAAQRDELQNSEPFVAQVKAVNAESPEKKRQKYGGRKGLVGCSEVVLCVFWSVHNFSRPVTQSNVKDVPWSKEDIPWSKVFPSKSLEQVGSASSTKSAAIGEIPPQMGEGFYSTRKPLIARAITSCWISEVPSKMV